MFDTILLEVAQKDLLSDLVEASRAVPREERQKFLFIQLIGAGSSLRHPGLPNGNLQVYGGDVDALEHEDLIADRSGSTAVGEYDVTPLGFAYYEHLKKQSGESVARMERETRSFIDAAAFRRDYTKAYQKWAEAEQKLWASDSQKQLTTIGHLCREAIQEFATALVDRYQPATVDPNMAHAVARIRAVLQQRLGQLGSAAPFLDALVAYWGELSDLVQRQEHGAQKEGTPLIWEDARRVIFQTAVLMFEIERSLARSPT